jgi:hypothetical protein
LFDVEAEGHRRTLIHLTAQESFSFRLHRDDPCAYAYSRRCPRQPAHREARAAVRNFQRARQAFGALRRR